MERYYEQGAGITDQLDEEIERIKKESINLCSYIVTVRTKNTDEWMNGLADIMNNYLKFVNDVDRVSFNGEGLSIKREVENGKAKTDKSA